MLYSVDFNPNAPNVSAV